MISDGLCRQRREHRAFRISGLKNRDVATEPFERKALPGPEEEERNATQQPLITLELHCKAQALSRLYDYFDEYFFTPNDDDGFI